MGQLDDGGEGAIEFEFEFGVAVQRSQLYIVIKQKVHFRWPGIYSVFSLVQI